MSETINGGFALPLTYSNEQLNVVLLGCCSKTAEEDGQKSERVNQFDLSYAQDLSPELWMLYLASLPEMRPVLPHLLQTISGGFEPQDKGLVENVIIREAAEEREGLVLIAEQVVAIPESIRNPILIDQERDGMQVTINAHGALVMLSPENVQELQKHQEVVLWQVANLADLLVTHFEELRPSTSAFLFYLVAQQHRLIPLLEGRGVDVPRPIN